MFNPEVLSLLKKYHLLIIFCFFTGLYFNKAADSCDYTRNVICNKKEKEKPTTKAPKVTPTTPKTTSSRVITTTTTTTTTTEAPVEEELEEDDEYYEEHAEEDPQAIKQLIQLIKKLGEVILEITQSHR